MTYPFGNNLKLNIDGTSHGEYISARLCGMCAGIEVDTGKLSAFMARRAPGNGPLTSSRRETDEIVFISGLSDGKTDGKPLEIRIYNRDARPSDYHFEDTPRPSHADYPAVMKYGRDIDLKGGGHFSGRLTAALCAVGGICLQYLESRGITVFSHIASVGEIRDAAFDPVNVGTQEKELLDSRPFRVLDTAAGELMRKCIAEAAGDGDSVGGTVECAVCGLDAGLGEHMFAGVEGRLASALFAIPAVKGVEFGSGFRGSTLRGSENNDPFVTDGKNVRTDGNNAGGILGGMTTGMPVIFRAAFKPTPSIAKPQKTVCLSKMENTCITVGGRHDPCIVARAAAAAEAAAAAAICDILLDPPVTLDTLADCRTAIDSADINITDAYLRRLRATHRVGELKRNVSGSVFVPEREKSLLDKLKAQSGDKNAEEIGTLYSAILSSSRSEQRRTAEQPLYRGYSDKKMILIGSPLGHSLSPELHSVYADHSYTLRDINPENLEGFMCGRDFDALNVTIPYKKAVIPYLDRLSPEAEAIGAVNTVIRETDGTLTGYNTDTCGFARMLDASGTDAAGKRAVIMGNGGAAAAVRYVLEKRGASRIFTVARHGDGTYPYSELERLIDGNTLLVNATPVGMYPQTCGSPIPDGCAIRPLAYFDLIYNPFRTAAICGLEEMGISCFGGALMLASQAAESLRLLGGIALTDDDIIKGMRKVTRSCRNIVLIGMPGSGKTTAAARLAQILGTRCFDTDEDVRLSTGYTAGQYILKFGEAAFREEEHRSCLRASHIHGGVISVGGGAVTNENNYLPLRTCGIVVRLMRPHEELETSGRPLSMASGIAELAEAREPMYRRFADINVQVDRDTDITVSRILAAAEEFEKRSGYKY